MFAEFGERSSMGAVVRPGTLSSFERSDLLSRGALSGAILEEIAGELELRPLLKNIVTRACDLLDADHGAIGLYVPHRHAVQIEVTHQLPTLESGRQFRSGEGLLGGVLAVGRPLLAKAYSECDRLQGNNSVLGVPIPGPDRALLGVLGVGMRSPRKFCDSDLDTLALLARHLAIAIHNAMRYEREQRRAERMTSIARVSRVIAAGLDANELAVSVARAIREQLGYPKVAIRLPPSDDADAGLVGAALKTRKTQIANNGQKNLHNRSLPAAINASPELAVPIVLGEEVFGCLDVVAAQPFDDDDIASLQIVADHLAVAIKNIQLSREARNAAVIRERQRLAHDLHDAVSQALSSISLMSQSIVKAWRTDPAEGERRANRIEALARLAFAEMRGLLHELRPGSAADRAPCMDDAPGVADVSKIGLAAALQRFACILAPQTPSVRLDFSTYRPQLPAFEERLYLICREALSNAVRHSGAERLDVCGAVDGDRLTLRIQDNGRGFDTASCPDARADFSRQGIGLHSMSERAAALGGVCEVQSRPGVGTTVCIRVQLFAR